MLGRVIVEIGEMQGGGRADIASLKSFLSRRIDRKRLAYRRDPEEMRRMCVFVGTANEPCLPNDASGNRNFVTIQVKGRITVAQVVASVKTQRDQLWAEAKHLYETGETAWLNPDFADIQADANEDAIVANSVIEEAAAFAVSRTELPTTMTALVRQSGLIHEDDPTGRLNAHQEREFGKALRKPPLNLIKKRVHREGKLEMLWMEAPA